MGWIVEGQVPNQRFKPHAFNVRSRTGDLQVLQRFGIPEALSEIDVRSNVGRSNVPDPTISPGGDLQVLLEIRHSAGSASLILLVAGRPPGVEIRFQNLGPEIIIISAIIRVVSSSLNIISVALKCAEHCEVTW